MPISLRTAGLLSLVLLAGAATSPRLWAADERSEQLLAETVRYGDSHFDAGAFMVAEPGGEPNAPEYSLPYATALLATGGDTARAAAVIGACLDLQDTGATSPTRGLFRWKPTATTALRTSVYHMGPQFAWLYRTQTKTLGEALSARVKTALDLALKAVSHPDARTKESDQEQLQRLATAVSMAKALGDASLATQVAAADIYLTRWLKEVSASGRLWAPSPSGDVLRILALERLWESMPESSRPLAEQALRLCYLDFAQRVHPDPLTVAGASDFSYPEEIMDGRGIATGLIYRNFGGKLTGVIRPYAAAIALSSYRPPADIAALVRPVFKPYEVQTGCSADSNSPSATDTYLHPNYTLGTMSGWCLANTVPVLATFSHYENQPTAFFRAHGTPAHVNALQCSNFALCSFNFDHLGVEPQRMQAYVKGNLGSAREIQEVYAMGSLWQGDAIAVGSRGTVVVKRGGAYLAITLLECGPVGVDITSRRKPGVLEWEGEGEYATLALTIYARQEEYRLPRAADDWRAGFAIQIWNGDQFDSTQDVARWLETSRITQKYAPGIVRTSIPRETNPVLDRNKPQPKKTYVTTAQKVHTIDYSYRRGDGNHFTLIEDLRREQVMGRLLNDQPLQATASFWNSPAFLWTPKQSLEAALTPTKAAAEPGASVKGD